MILRKLQPVTRYGWIHVSSLHCSVPVMAAKGSNAVVSAAIKNDTIQQYQQDGVVYLRGLFSEYWVNKVREGIRKVFLEPSEHCDRFTSKDGEGIYFNDYYQWRKFREFHEYVTDSPVANIAATLMGVKEVTFYHEHVFVKESFNESETPWHHDQPYYPVDGWQNCSVWMPVTPVEARSGLKFIKGSHRWGKWFAPRKFETFENYSFEKESEGRIYETMFDINEEDGEHEILSWDMEPGDCLVFHMRSVHGTYGSTSTTTRQTLATRWLGDDATLARRPWTPSPPAIPDDIKYGDPMKNSKHYLVLSMP